MSIDKKQKDFLQQQQSLDEREKEARQLHDNLEKQKQELQEKETTRQRQHIEQMLQLQTEREELHKQLKQILGQLEKKIKDNEDFAKRHRVEYDLLLQQRKNQEEELQRLQEVQDEREKKSKVIELPAECKDVAVTKDGHLLLAAMEHGMLEYNVNGKKLKGWTPAKRATGEEDMVLSVDELQDGRIAVGAEDQLHAFTVQLLSHKYAENGSWHREQIIKLQGSLSQLSVHKHLIAVAGGAWFELLCLSDGHDYEQHRYRSHYCIKSVAVTSNAVITASAGLVQLRDESLKYVVDNYSHSGQLLRTQTYDEQVYDLHWSEVHSALYMALQHRVTAAMAGDLQHLSEVVRSYELKQPRLLCKLALSRGEKTVLAVLHADDDKTTVTVCPDLGSGGSK